MSLFSTAYAATTTSATNVTHQFMSFLPMIVIFILFWFLLIRPQQKKSKLHNQMISALQKNDHIVTNSGIFGKIIRIEEQFIALEVADNVVIKIQKNTVANKVEKELATAK